MRLGVAPKGIIGSGVTLTAPETRPHWREERAAAGNTYNFTTLRLERLFELPLVTFDELTVPPFRRFRWGVRSSGTYLPETIADALEDLWEARVARAGADEHGRQPSSGLTTPRPPRLSTWVYTIVVLTSEWPRSSCTVRMS